jgi:hypothetical protein
LLDFKKFSDVKTVYVAYYNASVVDVSSKVVGLAPGIFSVATSPKTDLSTIVFNYLRKKDHLTTYLAEVRSGNFFGSLSGVAESFLGKLEHRLNQPTRFLCKKFSDKNKC